MKLYSEVTKKFYDNTDAGKALLAKEEAQLNKAVAEKKSAEIKKSTEKKLLAEAIDNADKALKVAFELETDAKEEAKKIYKKAKDECGAIMKKADTDVAKILGDARQKVADAQDLKCKAISEFNEKYGAYTKVYSGEDAKKEYQMLADEIADMLSLFPIFR